MRRTLSLVATLLAAGLASSTLAQDKIAAPDAKPAKAQAPTEAKSSLTIGDAAPAIDIAHFVKGDPITGFEAGKITVVEFWATWCGPCKISMPHISELQERYKDYGVRVLSISDEKLEIVKPFVESPEWSAKMRYTVATDPDRSVYKAYMSASGQRGIPTAFVVGKKGTIEWIGHPTVLDNVLESVVHDTWDTAKAKADFDLQRAKEAEAEKDYTELMNAYKAKDWNAMLATFDRLIAKAPENQGLLIQKMQLCLTDANRPKDGYAIARSLAAKSEKNAMMLNQIAWLIIDPNSKVAERDVKFATEVAEKACEASGHQDGSILDTLARCYFTAGDKAKAIETQKKAVELAPAEMKADLEASLKEYQAAK